MARKKKQDEDLTQENLDNSDDTFGLPEIEYEPLRREEPREEISPVEIPEPLAEHAFAQEEEQVVSESPQEEEQPKEEEFVGENQFYEPYTYQDESPAVWPKVLGILLIVIIAAGAIWYFVSYRPKQLATEAKQRRELLAIQEEARKKQAEQQAAQQKLAEEQRLAAAEEAEAAAKLAAGTIETLSGRTGAYYVVVASSIDGDLIMDYAKRLSAKGVTAKIIPPFGKSKFHRLAVAQGDTYANAQATADGMKGGEYGDKVWVVKY
ncbi:MAG: hypothetical protein OEV24_12645 [Cyclobacteriaceae bacterium]|nr:hypothetical protein [Cyclobacteriaceae bacterium]MDH5250176.1 hypothetical protein [Cyclobacteriaceae bacterium]